MINFNRFFIFTLIIIFTCKKANAQDNISPLDQEIKYTNCNNCWNADSLGNHRAVINVTQNASLVKVILPWRRRDIDPQNKRIIIQDAKTNTLVADFNVVHANREMGEIIFSPTSGKGIYYIYYMPYKNEGRSNYPKGVYLKPLAQQDKSYITSLKSENNSNITFANLLEFQSIDSLNSFYPMEVIATMNETKSFIDKAIANYNNKGDVAFIVVPEKRELPIKMVNDLPQKWMKQDTRYFNANADKGEWFAFKLGLFALKNTHNV
ncbi:MAG: glycoside hydrolase domain-containing protein [Sediminibacterium sp.]